MEITLDTEDQGKEVLVEDMGEPKGKEEMVFESLLKAMNDLAKAQKTCLMRSRCRTGNEAPRIFYLERLSVHPSSMISLFRIHHLLVGQLEPRYPLSYP